MLKKPNVDSEASLGPYIRGSIFKRKIQVWSNGLAKNLVSKSAREDRKSGLELAKDYGKAREVCEGPIAL